MINVAYIFQEGNELNIAFQFVILILQNYIHRIKLYHGIWNIFTVIIFLDVLLQKNTHAHTGIPSYRVLESRGRLDKMMQSESSVKTCIH